MFKRLLSAFLLVCFVSTSINAQVYAQALILPEPGTMVTASVAYVPVIMKGVTIHQENPLLFDFIIDTGNSGLSPERDQVELKEESQKLVKYFLASLALPEADQWVNLSPFEKDRILPEELGRTDLGRDMLAQDYLLKQVTASFIHPDKDLGKAFWSRVYARAEKEFGVSEIPMDAFNKVWITAEKANVFVNKDTAFVVGSHLKVMLESDYLAEQKSGDVIPSVSEGSQGSEISRPEGARNDQGAQELAKQVVREIVLPELEKEVNTGKNFSNLRQIFHSMILATWYKKNLKEALLGQVYADKKKTDGVEGAWVGDRNADVDPQAIWMKYEEAYKKGVFNFIKEDIDQASGEAVPHKYFSGGVTKLARADVVPALAFGDTVMAGTAFKASVAMQTGAGIGQSRGPELLQSDVETLIELLIDWRDQGGSTQADGFFSLFRTDDPKAASLWPFLQEVAQAVGLSALRRGENYGVVFSVGLEDADAKRLETELEAEKAFLPDAAQADKIKDLKFEVSIPQRHGNGPTVYAGRWKTSDGKVAAQKDAQSFAFFIRPPDLDGKYRIDLWKSVGKGGVDVSSLAVQADVKTVKAFVQGYLDTPSGLEACTRAIWAKERSEADAGFLSAVTALVAKAPDKAQRVSQKQVDIEDVQARGRTVTFFTNFGNVQVTRVMKGSYTGTFGSSTVSLGDVGRSIRRPRRHQALVAQIINSVGDKAQVITLNGKTYSLESIQPILTEVARQQPRLRDSVTAVGGKELFFPVTIDPEAEAVKGFLAEFNNLKVSLRPSAQSLKPGQQAKAPAITAIKLAIMSDGLHLTVSSNGFGNVRQHLSAAASQLNQWMKGLVTDKAQVGLDVGLAASHDSAMSVVFVEDMKRLRHAEARIKSILDRQLAAGDITPVVYKNAVDNTYKNLYEWVTDPDIFRIDPSVRRAALKAIRDKRWDDIIEAFRQDVPFGTAGIRGKAVLSRDELDTFALGGPMAVFLKAPNTINAFKLLKMTAGVIRVAQESGRKKTKVVLGYDSRIGGERFVEMIARLFIAKSTPEHEFQLFMFDEASPFPEVSFAVKDALKADVAIFISASHNSAEYNGYKITGGNGAQLDQKGKDAVVAGIGKVANSEIILADSLSFAAPEQIVWLGGSEPLEGKDYLGFERIDLHSQHVEQVKKFILMDDQTRRTYASQVKIGYAAYNGAGYKAVPRLLQETGFTNFKVVSELQVLDGRFPAFAYGEQPDPGDPVSAARALEKFAQEHGQQTADDLDILIGTDPDADRLGLLVKIPEAQQKWFGKHRLLSANDVWTILLWYRLTMKKEKGLLEDPSKHVVLFSHVTTDALEAVARKFGVQSTGEMMDMTNTTDQGGYLSGRRTWVGFTYLATALEKMEKAGKFVEMLCEESNGVSLQGHTKEKDGTLAAILMAEVAAYAKANGTSLFEILRRINAQIGHYATANKAMPRVGSFEKAAGISEKIKIVQKSEEWLERANALAGTDRPFMISGKKVIGAVKFASGRIDKTHYQGIPDEGVRFFFEDDNMKPGEAFTESKNYLTVRVSGTSQALRFYTQIYTKDVSPEQMARNYYEAERVALEAQKQILHDTGLRKHLSAVEDQLETFYANRSAALLTAIGEGSEDPAQTTGLAQTVNGGIDLNAGKMDMVETGDKAKFFFDPAMVAEFQSGNFTGVTPVILNITPIRSLVPLLGFNADVPQLVSG